MSETPEAPVPVAPYVNSIDLTVEGVAKAEEQRNMLRRMHEAGNKFIESFDETDSRLTFLRDIACGMLETNVHYVLNPHTYNVLEPHINGPPHRTPRSSKLEIDMQLQDAMQHGFTMHQKRELEQRRDRAMGSDATRIKNISSHYIRAQQAESEMNDREELRHLLFAAQDISELLEARVNNRMESSMATSYAESLCHCAARIRELIKEEDVIQHLLTSADQILNRANDDAKRENRRHS